MLVISSVAVSQSDSTHQYSCTGAQPLAFTAMLRFLKFWLLNSSRTPATLLKRGTLWC